MLSTRSTSPRHRRCSTGSSPTATVDLVLFEVVAPLPSRSRGSVGARRGVRGPGALRRERHPWAHARARAWLGTRRRARSTRRLSRRGTTRPRRPGVRRWRSGHAAGVSPTSARTRRSRRSSMRQTCSSPVSSSWRRSRTTGFDRSLGELEGLAGEFRVALGGAAAHTAELNADVLRLGGDPVAEAERFTALDSRARCGMSKMTRCPPGALGRPLHARPSRLRPPRARRRP